jgi:hypothetical protein
VVSTTTTVPSRVPLSYSVGTSTTVTKGSIDITWHRQ